MVRLLLIILLIVLGSKVVYKDNFAVISGNIQLTNGAGSVTLEYPTGFTRENCVPISIGIDIVGTDNFSYFFNGTSNSCFEVRFGPSNLFVNAKSIDGLGTSNTKQFKLVLMKTN